MSRSIVMLFDAERGDFVKESLFCLPVRKALISAVMQEKGDFNTASYPDNLPGIYKSSVRDRLLFDLDETHTMYAQKA